MRTFNYYDRLRTLSPSKYYKLSTLKQMQEDANLLGNKFYDHLTADTEHDQI